MQSKVSADNHWRSLQRGKRLNLGQSWCRKGNNYCKSEAVFPQEFEKQMSDCWSDSAFSHWPYPSHLWGQFGCLPGFFPFHRAIMEEDVGRSQEVADLTFVETDLPLLVSKLSRWGNEGSAIGNWALLLFTCPGGADIITREWAGRTGRTAYWERQQHHLQEAQKSSRVLSLLAIIMHCFY